MTSLTPLIGELDSRLELSEEKGVQRWKAHADARHTINDIGDRLSALANDPELWHAAGACGHCMAPLSELQVRFLGLIDLLTTSLQTLGNAAKACELAQLELVNNSTILVGKAVEGHLAYRPPEIAVATPLGASRIDIFAPPRTRVDMFNQGLGHVQPPPGPLDINDGYGDPGVEDATGVVRARPLVRPDLVKDPTDSIQISDM
jgi:hypothetical protein